MNTLRQQLKNRFPWLGTDDEANGGDVVQALADWYEQTADGPDDDKYREAAKLYHRDGDLEFDEGAVVSGSSDDGDYVQCWKWITDEEAGIECECGRKKSECATADGEESHGDR